MADSAPVVHIGENSPENVAFKLMHLIADIESRSAYGHGDHPMDREWVLRTYKQCRSAVSSSSTSDDVVAQFRPESFAGHR